MARLAAPGAHGMASKPVAMQEVESYALVLTIVQAHWATGMLGKFFVW